MTVVIRVQNTQMMQLHSRKAAGHLHSCSSEFTPMHTKANLIYQHL